MLLLIFFTACVISLICGCVIGYIIGAERGYRRYREWIANIIRNADQWKANVEKELS